MLNHYYYCRWYRTTTRIGLGRALLPRTRPYCWHYTAARITRCWHRTATRINKDPAPICLRTNPITSLVPIYIQTRTNKSYADTPMNLIRSRTDMPVSLNLSLAPYCYYYNRPLLPYLQLTNPYYFISS